MGIRIVNGIAFDGGNVWAIIGHTQIPCLKVSYGDKLEKTKLKKLGSQKIDAKTQGTYETEDAKFTIDSVDFRSKIMPLLAQNEFGNLDLSVAVGYQHPDLGADNDLLAGVEWTGLTAAAENSNKALEVEITLIVSQVYWTAQRKTINRLDDIGATTSNAALATSKL
jgi:hypothetical protein